MMVPFIHSICIQHIILTMRLSVWIVSNEQLLEYVRHPVPLSELDSFGPLKCTTPQVDPNLEICNGIPQNQEGLLSHCMFPEFPFFTCVCLTNPFPMFITELRSVVWLPAGDPNS